MVATASPVYCKDCGSRNSWQRKPEADIKSDSDQVMWKRWVCVICGHSTLLPALSDNVNGQGGQSVR